MSSEFLASSWKKFRGRGILSHTWVLCSTWVKLLWFASQPRKPYPPKIPAIWYITRSNLVYQVPYPNGEGGPGSGPYWSSQVVPRRFTEAPLGDEGGPEEEKVPPPVKGEGGDNPPPAGEGWGLEQTTERTSGELERTGEDGGGGGEREAPAQPNDSGHKEEAHPMPPSSVPGAQAAVSSTSMPPPSFKPLHPRTATSE